MNQPAEQKPELIVVMPVYNEEAIVNTVVQNWMNLLDKLKLHFELDVHDDGSTDQTWQQLQSAWASHPRVRLTRAVNAGHGPAILRAYRDAAKRADWMFQTDSDDEIPPDAFELLWDNRQHYDLLLGYRTGRASPLPRRLVTSSLRLLTRLLFGGAIHDVNIPYRLIRSSCFKPVIEKIPPDTFAPNVLISAHAARSRARIYQTPVPANTRKTGTCSLHPARLARATARSLLQTIHFRFTLALPDFRVMEDTERR